MSERDDVRGRIFGPESGDPGQPWDAAAEVTHHYDRRHKGSVLTTYVFLLIELGVMYFGVRIILYAEDTKLMLLGAILFLLGYESTVLMKLWYWIVQTNLRTLRELKRMQLIAVGGNEDVLADEPRASAPLRWMDRVPLPLLRRLCAVILVLVTIGFVLLVQDDMRAASRLASSPIRAYEYHAQVDASGAVHVNGRIQYPYAGVTPIDAVTITSPVALEQAVWREARGQALQVDVTQAEGAYLYRVALPQPVYRDETVDLRVTWLAPPAQRLESGEWLVTAEGRWQGVQVQQEPLTLSPVNRGATETITFPAGTRIVEATPSRWMQWSDWDGRPTVSFCDPREPLPVSELEANPPTVRYTLPGAEAPAQGIVD